MYKYLTLLTVFVFVGCTDPIYLYPEEPQPPTKCQTLLNGRVVVVDCDTLVPCTSDRDCADGFYCLNDKFCVNDCLTDETCERRFGDDVTCNSRGRCVGPVGPPVEPPVPLCPAYIGGVIYEDVPCDALVECDPEADECWDGTFCLNGEYNYCASQCFTDFDCPEFVDFNGEVVGNMVCNDRGLCENPDPLPVCGEDVETVPANVVFIVDRSGSMGSRFGDTNRYDAVATALLNVVSAFPDGEANFSAVLYNREFYSKNDYAACAGIEGSVTDFSTDIEDLFYSNSPYGYTPTGNALAEILTNTFPENTVFVLATDGLPNGCDGDDDQRDEDYSVSQVAAANDLGIKTYVLGISLKDSTSHLSDLAAAGNTGLGFFNAEDPDELDDALLEIVGNIVTPIKCEPLNPPLLPELDRPDPPVVVQ